ncbi:MAG: isochorismatase family protein [Betaproteobacteria bacterium]|nr:isochorismatase family protein [Betaproteobacteria bacterium]
MNTISVADKSGVASFDVDAQNTFTPACPDELPVPDGLAIVAELNAQARLASVRIGSKDAHSDKALWVATPAAPQFSPVAGKNVDIRWKRHAEPGTLGFELIKGLPAPADYDFFVWKGVELDMHPYGACYHDLGNKLSTGVIEFLKVKRISTVIIGGLATDYCVKTTVLQLLGAGLEVVVNLGACRGIAPESTTAAVEAMRAAGARCVDSADQIR